MSKSKLGQSLMRTIDGGKSNEGSSSTDNVVDDAFEQASKNDTVQEFGEIENEVPIAEEPKIGEIEESLSSGEPIEAPFRAKPEKVKTQKQKKSGGLFGVVALLLAFVALGVAGYSVISQKAGLMDAQKNAESLETAIGSLNSRTDELIADLADTQKDVLTNFDRLVAVDGIKEDIQSLQTTIVALRAELDGFKGDLVSQGTSIEKHQKEIEQLSEQIKKLNARAASTPKQVVQRAPVKKANTDPSSIESAYVASIDLWGTQPYVMLREENGSWVPLTMGDYYKGWRLEGAIGSEAVFQKGSKTKRLTIKE